MGAGCASNTHFKAGEYLFHEGDAADRFYLLRSGRVRLEIAAPVLALLDAGVEVHCLRDLTRGGLASVLNEIAVAARVQVDIDESAVPVREEVRGACEILGLDPLYTANEGRFVAFISPRDLPRALDLLHTHLLGADAVFIGTVSAGTPGLVTLKNRLGSQRVLDLLSGEQLPRIC